MPTRFNILSAVVCLTRLIPCSGGFTDVLLTSRFNDGGVVDGILQMGMKGPNVWYKWDIRVRTDFIEKICTDECSVKEHGLEWSLRSFWNPLVHSGTADQCDSQGGVYDPTFACGADSRFNYVYIDRRRRRLQEVWETSCGRLRNVSLVAEEYSCSPSTDTLSCMMGDLSGKFGNLAPVQNKKWDKHGAFYTFKGATGLDPFPPSYLNYCDGEKCVDGSTIPVADKFGSVQITCPCGKQKLVCAKLNVEKASKDSYAKTETYGDTGSKSYANTGSKSYASKAYGKDDYGLGGEKGYATKYDTYKDTDYVEKAYDGDMHSSRYAAYDNHVERDIGNHVNRNYDHGHGAEYPPYADEYKRTPPRGSPSNSHYRSQYGNTGRDYTDTNYYAEKNY